MTQPVCAICTESINENGHTLDECGHTFHARCIVSWFRRASSCPMCRDTGTDNLINGLALNERSKHMMRISRNKKAPANLKKMADRVRVQQTALLDARRALQEHKRTNRDILAKHTRLNASMRAARLRLARLRRMLGVYHDSAYPLPPLLIDGRRRLLFNRYH